MRTSCNGCRVLRKGCSENCEIRPCIEWIKSPESQANATLFLAKFYGRAGLLNLINAGERHQRPGIFKSLLYEACGRIVNPTFGSVGLLSSGNWAQCQAAVDAVLAGSPIVETNVPVPHLNPNPVPPVNSCDIRHVSKDTSMGKNKNRFTRSMTRPKIQLDSITGAAAEWSGVNLHEFGQSSSGGGERSMQSLESVEAPWEMMQMNRGKPNPVGKDEKDEVGLELTLGSGFGKLNGKQ
ncbi:LOB domain-containing protein 42-like [Argentina anserina]|uniref:LOB domain-containing protein 42-like n=1 Tax=Argentina anserina TaxID=57926 RepID=UPI0021768F71|nr:LOB domain-containing protein 42-like [Potentilla anserina]